MRITAILFFLLLFAANATAQTAGDTKTFKKAAGAGDVATYTTTVNDALLGTNGSGTFGFTLKSAFANAAHTHALADLIGFGAAGGFIRSNGSAWVRVSGVPWTDLTGTPTTIGGYGITDFVTLGDAEWAQLVHTHVSVDITDGSTGGNTAADAGLVAKYNTEGQLRASVISSSTPAIWGHATGGNGRAGLFTSDNTGEAVQASNAGSGSGLSGESNTGYGLDATSIEGIAFHAHSMNVDAVGTPDIAEFTSGTPGTIRMTVGYDGGLTWTGTGAASTRSGLGLGTLATQSGTFSGTHSGTSSGTNTGDQTSIVGITGSLSEFNTALTGADFATGGGTVTGTSSGTNTGDQTITLTGPITGSGTGSFATTVAETELAAIAGLTSAADKGIQFTGSGTAATYDLTTAGKALLDDASASAQRTTLDVPSNAEAVLDVLVDAKGDVITATAADTPARLPVGTDGQALIARSTASTGLVWATPIATTISSYIGITWTNQPAAVDFIGGSAAYARIEKFDLTNATQFRVLANINVSGSGSAKLIARYRSTYSTTASDYSVMGASSTEVAVNISGAAGTSADSGWITIDSAAKGDVWVAFQGIDGNATADPQFTVYYQVR